MAGVALGSAYSWIILAFGMGTLMALDPLVAQALGAGDRPAVTRDVQRAVVLGLGLAVLASLALLVAGPVLTLLKLQPDAVAIAADFSHWSIPGAPAFLIFVVLRQLLQAKHSLRPLVVTVVLANLTNALLDVALIQGRWGFPALGPVGTAVSTSINRWFMFALLLGMSWPLVGEHLRPFRWREARRLRPLWETLRIGVPNGLMMDLEIMAFCTVLMWMNQLGNVQADGHQVAISLAALAFMVPVGIGAAAAVRVGHAIGRRDEHAMRLAARVAIGAGAAVMCVSAVLFALVPRALASLYTRDPAVLDVAATLLPIAAVFQIFDGVQIVANGVLRGTGDTRTPMLVYLFGYWMFGLPLAWWLGIRRGDGPAGMWWALVAALVVVAAILVVRVRARLARPAVRTRVE
jgi:MATE family multidrug resistance protein